jgi:ribosome maturation factor RimP
MITTDQLEQALERQLQGTPHFVVSAVVRPGGKAVVEVDHDEMPITLADLTLITKGLQEEFGEVLDDMEIQVGSPGLGKPFKVERQYRKRIGKGVDVILKDGTLVQGVLKSYDEHGISLQVLQPSKVKGRKPKLSDETTVIPFTEVGSTQATINLNLKATVQ